MNHATQRSPDEELFSRLFRTEERALLPSILRDVLQETLLALWSKRAEFDATKEFLPWASGIARFKVRGLWKKQPRWESFVSQDLMALIDARSAVLAPEISLRWEKLRDDLSNLPEEQRGVLQRYYSEDEPETYYIFQSHWSERPMLHIFGHGWPERWGEAGAEMEVKVYSNCAEVALFLNGKSVGVKKRNVSDYPAAGLRWRVRLTEGEKKLRAVSKDLSDERTVGYLHIIEIPAAVKTMEKSIAFPAGMAASLRQWFRELAEWN